MFLGFNLTLSLHYLKSFLTCAVFLRTVKMCEITPECFVSVCEGDIWWEFVLVCAWEFVLVCARECACERASVNVWACVCTCARESVSVCVWASVCVPAQVRANVCARVCMFVLVIVIHPTCRSRRQTQIMSFSIFLIGAFVTRLRWPVSFKLVAFVSCIQQSSLFLSLRSESRLSTDEPMTSRAREQASLASSARKLWACK